MKRTGVYGIMAEFDSVHTLLAAANRTREAGYKRIDAYSPFPIEGLAEAIGFHRDEVPLVVLIGGIIGGLTGYLMQYWISVVNYPVNVGGKPYHSWPSFIIVTFEMTILFAGISAVSACWPSTACPCPTIPCSMYRPSVRLQDNKFFLLVSSADPKFDAARTREFRKGLARALSRRCQLVMKKMRTICPLCWR